MTIDNPAEEDTRDVEEVAAPVEEPVAKPEKATSKKRTPAQKAARKRKAAAAKKQRQKKAAEPVAKKKTTPIVEAIPTTPGEIRDAAVELKDRAKAIGTTPFVEAAGGLAARLFNSLGDLFDSLEGSKKKDGS